MEVGLEAHSISIGAISQSAATTAVNGTAQNLTDYDGIIIGVRLGTADTGNFLKAQGGEASDGSDAADIAGSKVVADANSQLVALDIYKPRTTYVRGVVIRGLSSTTGDMFCIRYNAAKKPTPSQIANILKTVKLLSPAAGTP